MPNNEDSGITQIRLIEPAGQLTGPRILPANISAVVSNGKRYVRVPGTIEQANDVFEYFKEMYPDFASPGNDRLKKTPISSTCRKLFSSVNVQKAFY